MRELDAEWTEGKGEIPDILFHPQFASNDEDYKFCMRSGWGKSSWKSKYDNDREILNKIRKTGMPDGGTSQPAIGQPAIGSSGQSVLARGKAFESNILKLNLDGTWAYRNGTCISLSDLFAKCGRSFTMVELYGYYNQCRRIATKRPHAWTSPHRQMAAWQRKEKTGRWGAWLLAIGSVGN